MPRQSRSRPAPARPAPVQSRGAATTAMPPQAASHANPAHAPPVPPHTQAQTQSGQPGMLTQMAATAGSVAVGSTIGHGISSMLFGGSSARAPEENTPAQMNQQANTAQMNQQANTAPLANQQYAAGVSCENQAKEFTKCLEKADLPSCTWYLEQLKACQAAAAPY